MRGTWDNGERRAGHCREKSGTLCTVQREGWDTAMQEGWDTAKRGLGHSREERCGTLQRREVGHCKERGGTVQGERWDTAQEGVGHCR